MTGVGLRMTETEFWHPDSEEDSVNRAHNVEDVQAFVAYGYFEPLSVTQRTLVYGDASTRAWRWVGQLPHGETLDNATNWVLKAEIDGVWKVFHITGTQHQITWSLDIVEVNEGGD